MTARYKKPPSDLAFLAKARRGFETVLERSVRVSDRAMGKVHTGRQNRSLFVFAKLIANCLSMTSIVKKIDDLPEGHRLLDHFSLATLGRATIDASLMTMYISEPSLSRDQWDLRRQVLFLHDHSNRKRFLTAMAGTEKAKEMGFFANYPELRLSIQTRIKDLGARLGVSEDEIEELTKGQKVYLGGSRGAAREAGWDVDAFEFHQSYFSNWVHSYPVSFLRADEHKISFSEPSAFQLGFSAIVLESSTHYLRAATNRMRQFTGSMAADPIGQLD